MFNRGRDSAIRLRPERVLKDNVKQKNIKISINKLNVKEKPDFDIKFNMNKSKIKIKEKKTFSGHVSNFCVKLMRGAAIAVSVLLVVWGINSTGLTFGSEVIIDGESIGLVADREIVEDVIREIQTELAAYSENEFTYDKEASYISRIVSHDDVLSASDVKDTLLKRLNYMVESYAIMIEDELRVALVTEDAANFVLDKHMQKYSSDFVGEQAEVAFDKEVTVKNDFVPIFMLKTVEGALDVLDMPTMREYLHGVQEGDSLWGIQRTYHISNERIKELNPDLGDEVKPGDQVKIEVASPMLGVRFSQISEYNEMIPFETEVLDDENLYQGRVTVANKGTEGVNEVVAKITTENGIEINREILEIKNISNPITRVEKHGTKEPPRWLASGEFARPAYGVLSSRFGARWGRIHKGVDIAGAYGSDIKAADGGTVKFSGTESGYGYMVVIDHENGYETAYAHCSELYVSKGDKVAKGETIAAMGNSGTSTGTHVHFEVRLDGVHTDPLQYLNL